MAHEIRAKLTDVKALKAAVKDLEWYTTDGGYVIGEVLVDSGSAIWSLLPQPTAVADKPAMVVTQRRRVVEAGDEVIVETKGQQMARRFGDAPAAGVEGTVFRVLTKGPHPRGMKVELRDRTVGRVMKNLTMPGAGEPTL